MQDVELVWAHAWPSGVESSKEENMAAAITAAATPYDDGVLQRPCPPVLRCLSLARGGWGGRRRDRGPLSQAEQRAETRRSADYAMMSTKARG